MPDNERARIRSIMYEPSKVWLVTEPNGVRWLTDQYVLLDVSNAQVIEGVKDGSYQLMSTGEWRLEERDSIPAPDVAAYLARRERDDWRPAEPTEWSVAEHPGKAMLWSVELREPIGDYDTAIRGACLLGEPTWAAIKRHYPQVVVDWAPNESAGVFRFSNVWHLDPEDDCAGGGCDCPDYTFAYAAGIRIPEGQEKIAEAIVGV